ncbi:dnaJ homolog subfamily C member 30, mitochondrial-like [Achroia grisella]|uniref:dnaJ homolog subfamily C member 30, mitochondrial-like n=1 Tax=Achroia grisella TaxID=688607 RepID=UPI0027D2AFB6|nr:dnaJ homolog subfamily C member 30, mitochondrial-like [Achroia grisella]
MIGSTKSRLVSEIVRSISTSSWLRANHYDVLGVTPKATQSEIKSAYYKLSKVYHPDKSSDETSAKKFRAITEAYEVLGNIKLKKIYDKGLLVGHESASRMEYKPEPEPTDPTLKFYKSHQHRHITPTMDGRTPIYDFDAWSKNHYGNLFKKSQYDKDLLRTKQANRKATIEATKQEALIYLVLALTGFFFMLVIHGKEDYDQDMTIRQNAQKLKIETKRD